MEYDRLRNIFRNSNNLEEGESSEIRPTTIWVFGYGSLCWYPGFEYSKCITGYIRGYSRRFWQGNVTHRGTKEKVKHFSIYVLLLIFKKSI